jgi:malonyl-CoA/methylmalonyl-CoA synthetase
MSGVNHLFGEIHTRMPDTSKTFIETAAGEILTYAGLIELTGRYANALMELGVQPGDRVALQAGKSIAALVLYLATVRAGGVFLPLNPAYTPAEVDYFLADAEPRVFICDPDDAVAMEAHAKAHGVAHVEGLDNAGQGTMADLAAAAEPAFAEVARGPDDLAAILYTSGTTGRSKGAMLSHENLAANARVLVDCWRFSGDDVLLHALPVFHVHGLFVGTNVPLFAGASLLFLPVFDTAEIIRLMPRGTAMMGVPTFYTRLLQCDDFISETTDGMRLFISGSAPLSAETHKAFEARTGHAILERYGMTETNMNTSNPYDGERRPGTVGLPLPEVDIRISGLEGGAPLGRNEVGMIEVKGPNVFSGYWRKPDKTASEFREDGYFITGDMGVVGDDGYVSIVGREKDLIITGGLNVYPAEVEAALNQLNGVEESAVIGVPHPDFGEGIVAVIAPKSGAQLSEEAIQSSLSACLAKFKQPKKYVFVDALARNAMGKIEKAKLRETYKDAFDDG